MATIAVSTSAHAGEGARTDWFRDAGYGLFCHWSAQSVNADGSKKDYYTAVKEFDVDAFANQVDQTGAKFVIFTIVHLSHHLAFSSAVMDGICRASRPDDRGAARPDLCLERVRRGWPYRSDEGRSPRELP